LKTASVGQRGKSKPVPVTIYRIDMTGMGESFMNEKPDGVNPKITLDANHTVTVRVDFKDVKVTPSFQHLKIPIDSPKKYGEDHFIGIMKNNLPILREVLKKAEAAVKGLDARDSHKAKMIGKLVANIRAYCDKCEATLKAAGAKGLSFGEFRGNGADAGDAFGVQMMRLGSQTGVLLSLIGDEPAINCNWGRDRTSAMDAMIKQVAIQLDAGETPPSIFKADVTAETQKRNTQMLFATGNTDVARMTNARPHNIALDQSKSESGFAGLYDCDEVGMPALNEK